MTTFAYISEQAKKLDDAFVDCLIEILDERAEVFSTQIADALIARGIFDERRQAIAPIRRMLQSFEDQGLLESQIKQSPVTGIRRRWYRRIGDW